MWFNTLQTRMSQTFFYVLLVVAFLGVSRTSAESNDVEDQTTDSSEPDKNCGNNGYYIYDETKNDCVVNFPKLMKKVVTPYNGKANEDALNQKGLAKHIYLDGQKLFRGILVSVILFIACAALCVLSACIYCCHINYSDRKLEREVRALAKQMHKKYPSRRQQKPKAADPKAQSCNVIVEDAGVFVV